MCIQFWSTLGYFLCFARSHLLQTSVRFALYTELYPIENQSTPLPAPQPESKSPVRRASLPGSPSTNLSNPYCFFPPSHYGWRDAWPHPPVAEPSAGLQARNSGSPPGFRVQEAQKRPRKRTMIFGRKPRARATLYCTCAKPKASAQVTGLRVYSYRKNGPFLLARRGRWRSDGRSERYQGDSARICGSYSGCGEKAEQQKLRPGSEPAVKSNNYNKLDFYILI